jgi:hypothetical protein
MKQTLKYALAGMLAGGAALATTAPAQAGVGVSIEFGNGGYGYYGQDYYGYNYGRPCNFYFRHDLPAPGRCYRDFYSYYGPSVYLYDGFVFSSRGSYGHWRYNDNFRHWRGHNWNASHNNNRDYNRGNQHGWDGQHDRGNDRNGWNGDRHDNDGNGRNDRDGAHDRQNDGAGHDWRDDRRDGDQDRGNDRR